MRRFLPILLTFVALAGCQEPESTFRPRAQKVKRDSSLYEQGIRRPIDPIVATVNGVPIRLSTYKQELKRWGGLKQIKKARRKSSRDVVLRAALYILIDAELVEQELKRLGLKLSDDDMLTRQRWFRFRYPGVRGFRKYLQVRKITEKQLDREIAVELGLEKLLKRDGRLSIVEQELKEYYEINKFLYNFPARVKVSQIVVRIVPPATDENIRNAKKRAEELRQMVLKGSPFSLVARRFSTHKSSAKRGGDVGYIDTRMKLREWHVDLFKTEAGGVTPVHQRLSQDFIFYYVANLEPEGLRPLARVRNQVMYGVISKKMAQLRGPYLKTLRQKATIKILRNLEE